MSQGSTSSNEVTPEFDLEDDSWMSDHTRELNRSLLDEWSDEDRAFNELFQATYGHAPGESSTRRTRAPPKNRDREAAHDLLVRDYFAENPVYNARDFKTRFRMSRNLFLRIAHDLEQNFVYFQQRPDARGKLGFSCLQKCTAAVRLLAYGTASDSMDDYLKMSERTARESMYNFCRSVFQLYRKQYLRRPNANDIQQLYAFHEETHDLPGMLGSIDCMHWTWENCPNGYRGAYTRGDHGIPTVILEAVASQDMWIWHAFFGVAGSNNDLIVIRQSDVFTDVVSGIAPDSSFEVNGTHYKYGYYLGDGIYPEWSTIVKAFVSPTDEKRLLFKKAQESARKDVERAFGKLRKKWHILKAPCRAWYTDDLDTIMYAVLILHNMVIEDNGLAICTYQEDTTPPQNEIAHHGSNLYFQRIAEIQSQHLHRELRNDLKEHVWGRFH